MAAGLHPDLRPSGGPGEAPVFALNDLSFRGEERFAKYDEPLDRLLAAWMAGDTSSPVAGAFPFRVKAPRIEPDLTARLLDAYARERDRIRAAPGPSALSRLRFLGSRPLLLTGRKGPELRWRWRLGEERLRLVDRGAAEKLASLLESVSQGEGLAVGEFYAALTAALGEAGAEGAWKRLRKGGLVTSGS